METNGMLLNYRITFKNSLSHFRSVFYYLAAIVAFVLLMVFEYGSADLYDFIGIGVFFFGILMILPTVIIHLNYFFLNQRNEMIIDPGTKAIRFLQNQTWREFSYGDIEKVEVYMSPPLFRKSTGFTPWDSYHYTRLRLSDGSCVLITCLMANEWDLPFNHLPKEVFQSDFPIVVN